jgi:pyrroloquinoline quinone biosynthesis protein B
VVPRTQSSIAVTADDERWVVVNASPDLRQQIGDNPPLHPKNGKRDSPIAGVVLTNGDVDHVTGLLTLRESHPLAVYATQRILSILAANSIFNVLNPDYVARRSLVLDTPFEVADRDGKGTGVVMEAFAVPGKVALHQEDASAGPGFGTRPEDTIGIRISTTDGAGHFFYVPACARMTDELAKRLSDAPLVFFDGTLWHDDEMIAAGVGIKTGARMGHISVNGADGAMAAFAALNVERKIFIHINNTNPILVGDSAERTALRGAGWEVAHDGMDIRL